MKNNKITSMFVVIIFFIFIFQDFLTMFFPSMQYFDEFFCLIMFLFLLFYNINKANVIKFKKINFAIISLLCFYIFCGVISYLFNSSQPFKAFLGDLYLNLKYFLSIYIGYNILKQNYLYRSSFIKLIKIITMILFLLLLLNFIHPIFENQEIRFGIPIPKLFYSHSGYLASAGTLLLAMTYRFYDRMSNRNVYMIMQIFIVFSTLRYKAMATALVCTFAFLIVIVNEKKIKWWHIMVAGIIILFFSWNQIMLYYSFSNLESARGALNITSFKIASDYFPFGTGFGSFGSYMSKVYYSNVYKIYNLDMVWGLSRQFSSFISDTFWPMIIGQTGFLGSTSYLLILILIIKKTLKIQYKYSYMSCVTVLIYLLLESTSSSAFVSPTAVPFGLWLGILFVEDSKRKKEKTKFL